MTWDSDDPGFFWYDEENNQQGTYDIEGINYGTVTDPDIVLYDNDGNGIIAQIVYLLEDNNGLINVYYEVWCYKIGNPSSWVLATGPTAIT